MKTVRKLVQAEVYRATAFVTLGFLGLFLFFDMVEEMRLVGLHAERGYSLERAAWVLALKMPGYLYDVLPITVLIGTIFVMARMAQSSEFVVLRSGGLGPGRALWQLLQTGLVFVLLTFVVGDYISPLAEREIQRVRLVFRGEFTSGSTGAWLKERQDARHFAVNVRALDGDGRMRDVRIYEFNQQGQMKAWTQAQSGRFAQDAWQLEGVQQKIIQSDRDGAQRIDAARSDRLSWPTEITEDMVSASLLQPQRMRTLDLFGYMRHLELNNQNAQRYRIEFWRKVFYPLSCLVMITLALPFAYLHYRSGQIAGHVFVGVMAGISYYMLNNLFGFIGNLQNWQPLITSAAPAFIYSLVALGTFWWLVWRQ